MWRLAHRHDEWLPRSTRQALAAPEPPHLRGRLSRTVDGHALLTVTWGSLAFRKDIRGDGSFHALMEQGRDRLALCGSPVGLHLTYGTRSLPIRLVDDGSGERRRARELLLAAPVAQAVRRVGGDLEERGALHPEACGLRLTAALLAEIDGDESAVRRLGRAVIAHERAMRGTRPGSGELASTARVFAERVIRASVELEQRVMRHPSWSPARAAAALDWAVQIEVATFELAVAAPSAHGTSRSWRQP
jgi:hypothetical protein